MAEQKENVPFDPSMKSEHFSDQSYNKNMSVLRLCSARQRCGRSIRSISHNALMLCFYHFNTRLVSRKSLLRNESRRVRPYKKSDKERNIYDERCRLHSGPRAAKVVPEMDRSNGLKFILGVYGECHLKQPR